MTQTRQASPSTLMLVPLPTQFFRVKYPVVLRNTSTHSETHTPAAGLSCLSKNRGRSLLLNHQVGIQCALSCLALTAYSWLLGVQCGLVICRLRFSARPLEGLVSLRVLFFLIVRRQRCRWLIVYDFRKAVILDTLEGEREKKQAEKQRTKKTKKKSRPSIT